MCDEMRGLFKAKIDPVIPLMIEQNLAGPSCGTPLSGCRGARGFAIFSPSILLGKRRSGI